MHVILAMIAVWFVAIVAFTFVWSFMAQYGWIAAGAAVVFAAEHFLRKAYGDGE